MDERNDNPAGGSADFLSAVQIKAMVDRVVQTVPEQGEDAPQDLEPPEGMPIEAAREHLANVIYGSEPAVPQSPDVDTTLSRRERGLGGPVGSSEVVLTPETELEMIEAVDTKKSRRTRAKDALIKAGKRMEEGALNVAAKVIVRNTESAVDRRLRHVDNQLKKISPEDLRQQDDDFARYYEEQRLFLTEPTEKRSIDQVHRYHRWEQRRNQEDSVVAEAVAAAEAPIQARIDEITKTGLFGVQFAISQGPDNKMVTPLEFQGTHYEWKPGDPRFDQFGQVYFNNRELSRLVGEKLAARDAVLAQHSGGAKVQ